MIVTKHCNVKRKLKVLLEKGRPRFDAALVVWGFYRKRTILRLEADMKYTSEINATKRYLTFVALI